VAGAVEDVWLRVHQLGIRREHRDRGSWLSNRCAGRRQLEGICPEVTRLLEPHRLGIRCFAAIRRMKPLRQIEAAEHMIASNNFTLPFQRAIPLVTKPEMLNKRDLKGRLLSVHGPANALLAREHEGLVLGLKAVECSFGSDMLCLAVSLNILSALRRILRSRDIWRRLAPKRLWSSGDS
jgi:hypothetical protein